MSTSPGECWSPVAGMRAAWLLEYDRDRYPFARFLREAMFGVEDCDGPVGADQSLAARHKLLLR